MSDTPIPADVSRFLTEQIHSVEQLEILLWTRENSGPHDARQVANALRTTEHSAEERLVDLARRGLLAEEGAGRYRYAPATGELTGTVDLLSEVYRQAPYAVINVIFSKPVDKIRTFADAFRLRKEDT